MTGEELCKKCEELEDCAECPYERQCVEFMKMAVYLIPGRIPYILRTEF